MADKLSALKLIEKLEAELNYHLFLLWNNKWDSEIFKQWRSDVIKILDNVLGPDKRKEYEEVNFDISIEEAKEKYDQFLKDIQQNKNNLNLKYSIRLDFDSYYEYLIKRSRDKQLGITREWLLIVKMWLRENP